MVDLLVSVTEEWREYQQKLDEWKDRVERVRQLAKAAQERVALDVGGTKFVTTATVLHRSEFFRAMTSRWTKDGDGCYFIDQSPQKFVHILRYLRFGKWLTSTLSKKQLESLSKLADYFGLEPPITGNSISWCNPQLAGSLVGWLGEDGYAIASVEPLYKASRDGWSAEVCHSRIDNRGPILVVAQTTTGIMLGAMATQSWDSCGCHHDAPRSWTFTTNNASNVPTRFTVTNNYVPIVVCQKEVLCSFSGMLFVKQFIVVLLLI